MGEVDIVFGSSGFVGTHLIRRLRHSGRRVIAVDVKPARERLNGVDYVVGDVRDLAAFQADESIGCIYNLAAVHTTPGHPNEEYYDTNVNGALEVTRLADRLGVSEIVFTSSISVYGPGEDRKTESSPPSPVSAYGYSKLLAEKIHLQWAGRQSGRRLTIVRPAVVFGPGEGGNFTRMAGLLKKGFFIYPGRKDTVKACIYIDDLLRAIEFARTRSEELAIFNGAYPGPYTLQAIVESLIEGHFRNARTYMIPTGVVRVAAGILGRLKFLNIGIHPDRVLKLVRSTDVYPAWLVSQGFAFPSGLGSVVAKWKADTSGTFI